MVINTKTNTLTLTVRERKTLQDALNLVAQLEKHGGNAVSLKAEDAATTLGALLEVLTPMEVAK